MARRMTGWMIPAILFTTSTAIPAADDGPLELTLRSRTETANGTGRYHTVSQAETWDPEQTAIIVCDVWDLHHCLNAVRRAEEFAPRLNELLNNARDRGVTIIHAPSGCMDTYTDHPARKRATSVPLVADLPEDIQSWCSRIPSEEAAVYPIDQSDGGEDDDPEEHAQWAAKLESLGRNPNAPWKAQSNLIEIDDERDFISDKGDEVWSILASRGIDNVILSGVHTNMCVLGRPFGLRQMAKNGKHVVLLRDMTDTMYNPQRWPYVSHFTGTDLIIEHIEKFVCPTITSDQLIGGETFRFKNDKRPHLVMVVAEDEYKTEETLPVFARDYLGKGFRVSFVFGNEEERNDIPGLEVLDDADAMLISVRRRVLPHDQMAHIRSFIESGKPVIGLRTASHAFVLRNQEPPEGYADWPGWDPQIFGGNYTNHYGNKLKSTIRIDGEHAILTGIPDEEFGVGGSLYKVAPLEKGTTPIMFGRVEGQDEEPVAWTFQRDDGGRSFYTSLGHVDDFKQPAFLRMLTNGIYWAAGVEIPEEFTVVGTIDDYRRHWMPMPVPGTWAEGSRGILADYEGPAWYRCTVRVPGEWTKPGRFIYVELKGNAHEAWWNGEQIRGCAGGGEHVYFVPPKVTHPAELNLLTVRVEYKNEPVPQNAESNTLSPEEPDQRATKSIQDLLSSRGPHSPTSHRAFTEEIVPRIVVHDFGESDPLDPIAVIELTGTWQFRLGDDPSFATLPLPAKFAASTDVVFEPAGEE